MSTPTQSTTIRHAPPWLGRFPLNPESRACPDCGLPKRTDITWTFCWACTQRRLDPGRSWAESPFGAVEAGYDEP